MPFFACSYCAIQTVGTGWHRIACCRTFGFVAKPNWAFNATTVSSFFTKIRRLHTWFACNSTSNVIEFTRAAVDARSLSFIILTVSNGTILTSRRIFHAARTILTRTTHLTPGTIRSSTTSLTFGTAIFFGRPPSWTLNATTVSSFSTKVSRVDT